MMAMISPALEAYAGQPPYCHNGIYTILTSLKQDFPSAEAFSRPTDHTLHIETYSILMSLKQDFPSAELSVAQSTTSCFYVLFKTSAHNGSGTAHKPTRFWFTLHL